MHDSLTDGKNGTEEDLGVCDAGPLGSTKPDHGRARALRECGDGCGMNSLGYQSGRCEVEKNESNLS